MEMKEELARESYRDFGRQAAWYNLACILAMLDSLGTLGANVPCKEFGLDVLWILRDQVKQ